MICIIIYLAINRYNSKVYIGQTTNTLEYRKSQHFRETECNKKKNTYFHNAIAKYGKSAFSFTVIDTANSLDELNAKERYWIYRYNSTDKRFGYNLDSGGKNCKKSASTLEKMRASTKSLWEDEEKAKRMLDGLRRGTATAKRNAQMRKVECMCENCGTKFYLPPNEAKKRRFCSQNCANAVNIKKATDAAINRIIERHKALSEQIASDIYNWCRKNQEAVLACPLNNVSTVFEPMRQFVENKYGIKDMRSIIQTVTGNYNKKEFANKMKDMLNNEENICRSGLN